MSGPNGIVPVALAAFVPFVLGCFMHVRPRHAVLVSLSAGWLFFSMPSEKTPDSAAIVSSMMVTAITTGGR